MNKHLKRLVLGTAQFGSAYGIKNLKKKNLINHINILKKAKKNKIEYIDTAPAYNESEKKIGNYNKNNFHIISKIPKMSSNCNDPINWVLNSTKKSLLNLKRKNLYAVLVHNTSDLMGKKGKKLYKGLKILKKNGLVKKIGISIYDIKELDWIIKLFKFDIVQVPFNILDRKLYTSGWLDKLKKRNIEIHCRSIFLQGLLLIKRNQRPKKFDKFVDIWNLWHDWLEKKKIKPIEATLSYVLSFKKIDKIIVGVDNDKQLENIIKSLKILSSQPPDNLATNNKNLINPSMWKNL
jgi:hypothetical protein